MHTTRSHIDMFNTHLSVYGVDGLLPQNLSPTLLQIISKEFNNFREENNNQDNHPFALLLISVLMLIRGEIIQLDDHESYKIPTDEVFENINSYGVSITLEELRRWQVIQMPEENLPTLDNIFDDNADFVVAGNDKEIRDILNEFKY